MRVRFIAQLFQLFATFARPEQNLRSLGAVDDTDSGVVAWTPGSIGKKDDIFTSVGARNIHSTKGSKSSKRTKGTKGCKSSDESGTHDTLIASSESESEPEPKPEPESESESESESEPEPEPESESESEPEPESEPESTNTESITDKEANRGDGNGSGGSAPTPAGSSGGGLTPTAPPTCIECDDKDLDKSEVSVDVDAYTVNIVTPPPTLAPTCVECDDGPKPARPPSNIPIPDKKPASESTFLDTLHVVESDGDSLGDSSGLRNMLKPLSIISICLGYSLFLMWTSA